MKLYDLCKTLIISGFVIMLTNCTSMHHINKRGDKSYLNDQYKSNVAARAFLNDEKQHKGHRIFSTDPERPAAIQWNGDNVDSRAGSESNNNISKYQAGAKLDDKPIQNDHSKVKKIENPTMLSKEQRSKFERFERYEKFMDLPENSPERRRFQRWEEWEQYQDWQMDK